MKKQLVTVLLFMTLCWSFSQRIKKERNSTYIYDKYSTIYENVGYNNNGDYRRGVYAIWAKLQCEMYYVDNTAKFDFYLSIAETSTIKRKRNFTKVLFEFSDGTQTKWLDFKYKTYMSEVKAYELTYKVSDLWDMFKNKPIKYIFVKGYDGEYVTLKIDSPYSIMSQADVINKVLTSQD